jgi:hypothetical protein
MDVSSRASSASFSNNSGAVGVGMGDSSLSRTRSSSHTSALLSQPNTNNANVSNAVVIGTPYPELCKDIAEKGKSKKLKNAKQFLSTMRNLLVYISLQNLDVSDELIGYLLTISREVSDQDSDRKIVRLFYSIVLRYVHGLGQTGSLLPPAMKSNLMMLVKEEIKNQSGSRLSIAHRSNGTFSVHSETSKEVCAEAVLLLKTLSYPTRGKGSVFGGQKKADKDYDNSIGLWIGLLSSIRRTGEIPGKDCKSNVLVGAFSDNTTIARHAIVVLGRLCNSPDLLEVMIPLKLAGNLQNHVYAMMLCLQTDLTEICDKVAGLVKNYVDKIATVDTLSCTYLVGLVTILLNNTNVPIEKAASLCSSATQLAAHSRCAHVFCVQNVCDSVVTRLLFPQL